MRRAKRLVKLFVFREEMTRKAKISQLHLDALVGQISAQDIFQLDIAMRDSLHIVHVVQREENLVDYFGGLIFSETTDIRQFLEQVASTDELCDDEVAVAVFHELEHPHDVGVGGLFEYLQFALHQFHVDFALCQPLLFYHFYGHRRLSVLVRSLVYCAKCPLRQLFFEEVGEAQVVDLFETFVVE